ncbi:ABC-2 transporter permease [Robinsoniella peoriensis]
MTGNTMRFLKMDFGTLATVNKIIFFYPLAVLLFVIVQGSFVMGGFMLIFLFPTLAMTPFLGEESQKIKIFYLSLPATVKNMVSGRYLFLFASALGQMAGGLLIAVICKVFGIPITGLDAGLFVCGVMLDITACLFMYPLVYKVGIAKGRSLIGVMPILAAGLVALLFTTTQEKIGSYQDIFQFVMNNGYYITAGVFVFVCILTVISVIISFRICEKQEI